MNVIEAMDNLKKPQPQIDLNPVTDTKLKVESVLKDTTSNQKVIINFRLTFQYCMKFFSSQLKPKK